MAGSVTEILRAGHPLAAACALTLAWALGAPAGDGARLATAGEVPPHWLQVDPGPPSVPTWEPPAKPASPLPLPEEQAFVHPAMNFLPERSVPDGAPGPIALSEVERFQAAIASAGVDQVDWLAEFVDRRDALYAVPAVARLAELGTPEARQAMRRGLALTARSMPGTSFDDNSLRLELRLALVQSMCRHDAQAEDRPYRAMLADETEAANVKAIAAFWAGQLHDRDCQESLRLMHRDPGSPYAEYAAAWALARLDDPVGWQYLRVAVAGAAGDQASVWAASGLGQMANAPEALGLLYPLLEREEPLRRQALVSLGRYPPAANDAFLRSLPDEQAQMYWYRRELLLYSAGVRKEPMPGMEVALFRGREDDRLLALAGLAISGRGEDIPLLLDLKADMDKQAGNRHLASAASLAQRTNQALRAIAGRLGLQGMPRDPSVPVHDQAGRSLALEAGVYRTDLATTAEWKEWWFRQYGTLACDDRQATLRDPLGRVVRVIPGEQLPGGALVGGMNEDGRGSVRLGVGDRVLTLQPLNTRSIMRIIAPE